MFDSNFKQDLVCECGGVWLPSFVTPPPCHPKNEIPPIPPTKTENPPLPPNNMRHPPLSQFARPPTPKYRVRSRFLHRVVFLYNMSFVAAAIHDSVMLSSFFHIIIFPFSAINSLLPPPPARGYPLRADLGKTWYWSVVEIAPPIAPPTKQTSRP